MDKSDSYTFKVIARIQSDFSEKFGIPRQSGLLKKTKSIIRFEHDFKNADALRGLEGFSHLWLLWIFSENIKSNWKATVRPPRLGGNVHLGVFATRSSFRPNPIAMSAVKIEAITQSNTYGPEIIVSGADLMNNTPIIDIKPYLPYADCITKASGGFTDSINFSPLNVIIDKSLLNKIPFEKRDILKGILENDPRPAYKAKSEDETRIYGFGFAGFEIKFKVKSDVLTVISIE